MPLASYVIHLGEEDITESDYFPKCHSVKELESIVKKEVIDPWNEYRKERGFDEVSLGEIKITNRLVHRHKWAKTRRDDFACKQHYRCEACDITGYRYLHIFNGEMGCVQRDEAYSKEKFYLCRDELKPMPKSTELRFR